MCAACKGSNGMNSMNSINNIPKDNRPQLPPLPNPSDGPILNTPVIFNVRPQGDGLYRLNEVHEKMDEFIHEKVYFKFRLDSD